MMKKIVGVLPVVGIAVVTSLAQAQGGSNQDFTLWNGTGWTIGELHVSSSNDNHWGGDVLGQGVLNDHEKAHITFTGYKPTDCLFDIKITKGEGGPQFVVQAVDLCKVDDVLFYSEGEHVMWKAH
jgi:hypothetical protein